VVGLTLVVFVHIPDWDSTIWLRYESI